MGDFDILDMNAFTVEDKIEFTPGGGTGEGMPAMGIGAFKAGSSQEQMQFMITPERIEIAGDNDRFFNIFNQVIQVAELVLAVAEFDGEMNQEDSKLF